MFIYYMRHILVIDETEIIAKIMEQIVHEDIDLKNHIQVLSANHCFDGLSKLIQLEPENCLVFIDYDLSDINGLELAYLIRQNPNYARTPLILLSEQEDNLYTRCQSELMGYQDMIHRHINREQVKDMIERYLK